MAGYRIGVKRYVQYGNLPNTIAGARATFTVPSNSNLNTVGSTGSVLYFLVNVNAATGYCGNMDGGIVKRGDRGDKWYAFMQGNCGLKWYEKEIPSPEGRDVNVKMLARKTTSGGVDLYYLELFIDGVLQLSAVESNTTYIASIYNDPIIKTSTEVTVVPVANNWSNFNNTNTKGQSFIKSATFKNAYPLDRNGNDYTGGDHASVKSNDSDFPATWDYYKRKAVVDSVNKVCTIFSSTQTSMILGTVDINQAGKIF